MLTCERVCSRHNNELIKKSVTAENGVNMRQAVLVVCGPTSKSFQLLCAQRKWSITALGTAHATGHRTWHLAQNTALGTKHGTWHSTSHIREGAPKSCLSGTCIIHVKAGTRGTKLKTRWKCQLRHYKKFHTDRQTQAKLLQRNNK